MMPDNAIPFYCELINLKRQKNRYDHVQKQLHRAGIKANCYPGVDMREVGEQYLLQHCKREGPWGVFRNQDMACTLSHVAAWQRFLATDYKYCFILEDDVFIAPDVGNWLKTDDWWPKGGDVVKFECWRSSSLIALLEPHRSLYRNREISRILTRHVGAAGYALSRSAATKLLQAHPYNIAVDNLIFNINASPVARNFNIYQIHPALVQQGNEPHTAPPVDATTTTAAVSHRPKGFALVRQKIKRGYYELAYSPSTLWKFLTKKAHITHMKYAQTMDHTSSSAQSELYTKEI